MGDGDLNFEPRLMMVPGDEDNPRRGKKIFHTEIAKITKRMMSYSPSSRSSIQAAGFHTEENSNTEIAKITKTDHEYRRVDRSFSQGPANCSIGVPSLCDLCDLCVKKFFICMPGQALRSSI